MCDDDKETVSLSRPTPTDVHVSSRVQSEKSETRETRIRSVVSFMIEKQRNISWRVKKSSHTVCCCC